MKRVALFVCAWLLATAAHAQTASQHGVKGNDVARACGTIDAVLSGELPESTTASPQEILLHGICLGIIDGVYFLVNAATKGEQAKTCVPNNLTGPQLVKVVNKYLRSHPEQLHERFDYLVVAAFYQAWPCKK